MEQAPVTDKRSLITGLRESDPHAYGYIVENYFVTAYKIALTFTTDKTIASTIVALVFQRLWDRRESIPEGSSLLAYLFKYVHDFAELIPQP